MLKKLLQKRNFTMFLNMCVSVNCRYTVYIKFRNKNIGVICNG